MKGEVITFGSEKYWSNKMVKTTSTSTKPDERSDDGTDIRIANEAKGSPLITDADIRTPKRKRSEDMPAFPAQRIREALKEGGYARDVRDGAALYLSAVLEQVESTPLIKTIVNFAPNVFTLR